MGMLYRATGLTCDSITKTFTHSLSRATNSLQPYITNKTADGVYVVGLGVNTVQVRGAADAQTFDLTVLEWHSIQGGPGAT